MIKIAIVEDEDIFADQLQAYIKRYQEENGIVTDVVRFTDGDEIVEGYTAEYQIILMDIQMRFMDGMTAAEKIREMDKEVVIIFITNMENYAIRGYQVDALDYVLKPIEYPSFSVKLKRAVDRIADKTEQTVTLKIPEGRLKISVDDIYYIESEGHNLRYYTRQGEYVIRRKVAEAVEELSSYGFFQVNKGNIVNIRHVDGEKNGSCIIKGAAIPISRSRKSDFMAAMTEYISKH